MNPKVLLLFFLITIILITTKCKKHYYYIPPAALPAITTEGKNTFGCKMNGELWLPFNKCPAFRKDCGEILAWAGNTLANGFFRVSINAGRRFGETDTRLSIATYPNSTISSTGDKSDSVEVYFYGDNYKIYAGWDGIHHPGQVKKFVITKFDTTNKIMSGIFDFTVYHRSGDSINITEGRFDLKFFVCKCSD